MGSAPVEFVKSEGKSDETIFFFSETLFAHKAMCSKMVKCGTLRNHNNIGLCVSLNFSVVLKNIVKFYGRALKQFRWRTRYYQHFSSTRYGSSTTCCTLLKIELLLPARSGAAMSSLRPCMVLLKKGYCFWMFQDETTPTQSKTM